MKKFIVIVVLTLSTILTTDTALSAYNAGFTEGWPNTLNGGMGKMTSTLNAPPLSYKENDKIIFQFYIENPGNNQNSIEENLYFKLWKIEGIDSNEQSISEDELNNSHEQNQDIQSHYKTIPVGQVSLDPGESSTFNIEVSIEDPGYYQYDLTDFSENSQFAPGHIYSAGFVRVLGISASGSQDVQGASTNILPRILLIVGVVISLFLLILLSAYLIKRRRKSLNTIF